MQGEFQSRLCCTLVADLLRDSEVHLVEAKSVRFLCDYPWVAGKRLRPIAFLLSNLSVRIERAGQASVDGRESRLAAAIELLHEASLVHDDLVDRAQVRRGVPTVQMDNGQGLALLIGDYMVFRGLKLVLDAAESRQDILLAQELANTGLQIAHGEADQLDRYLRRLGWDERMSLENYLDVIAKKTAAFFAGCCEAGAAMAGAPRELRQAYREFGLNFGIYFQIMDDLMDVVGDAEVARKSLRNNLAEGTVTLPMIHAWRLHPRSPLLRKVAAAESLDDAAQAALYRKLAGQEVIDGCLDTAEGFYRQAQDRLRRMPANIYRAGLADLLDYIRGCPWGGLERPRPKGHRKRAIRDDSARA
jgi:heptaprenyl diphosphate synthase